VLSPVERAADVGGLLRVTSAVDLLLGFALITDFVLTTDLF